MKIELIALMLIVGTVGCGGGDQNVPIQTGNATDNHGNGDKPAGDKNPWNPELGTVSVRGTVKFVGKVPRRRHIDMSGRAECSKLHTEAVLDESIIIAKDGSLANVFVWVKKGAENWKFPVPSKPVLIDQKGCLFHPHVQGVQVGQDILIRNSDPFLHNVHAIPNRNDPFNFGQAQQGLKDTRQFKFQDVMVRVKCDVHGWMSCFVGVVNHPFFTTTGEDGAFELPKLPAGEYTIEAWHEIFGKQTKEITVADGNTPPEMEFTFKDK